MSGSDTLPEAELDETAVLARDLIRLDTTNWGNGRSNGEAEAAEYVSARLRDLGLEPQTFESEPGRASVVARVEGADPTRPALVVHGHLDVVPADPANWTVDPFGGEIRDGMLWGRGAVDMKDMDAMILTALGDILGAGERPARDLVVAFFADEENGGHYGSQFLVDEHPELFAGATDAISEVGGYSIDIEGTRSYLLQVGEKTLSWIRLVARGTASHGSRVTHDNAIVHLAEALTRIGTREWPLQWTATTRRMIAELERLLDADGTDPDALIARTGTGAGFLSSTLRVTSNPTGLEAGYKHNVVPDRAEALIDIRTLPGDQERVLAEIRELAGEHVEIETVTEDVGLENPFEGPLVEKMITALDRHDPGAPVLPYLLGGGTDNKALSRLGIKGYGFAPLRLGAGLDFPAMFHGVDERVPLDALVFGRAVLGDFLRDC